MGMMKRLQIEEAELEYARHLDDLKAAADASFPGEDWDPEIYEAYQWQTEKED